MSQAVSEPAGQPHLPLSGVVVIDLTLARAGPTCVRHLADWGADVIRIEPPEEQGEDVTGRRDGFDFQNLHRNKRTIQLESQDAGRPRGVHEARRARRRDRREHARGGEAPAQGFVRRRAQSQPAHRLRQHQRLRPDRALRQARGRRSDRAGHGRAHVDHRTAGSGPGAGRHSDRRSHRGQPARARDLDGALRPHAHRRRPLGAHEPARSADFHARFPGLALADGQEVAKQAGNDHPTGIPTGVFPTSDGHINIAAASERVWERMCDAIGQPEWKDEAEMPARARRAATTAWS